MLVHLQVWEEWIFSRCVLKRSFEVFFGTTEVKSVSYIVIFFRYTSYYKYRMPLDWPRSGTWETLFCFPLHLNISHDICVCFKLSLLCYVIEFHFLYHWYISTLAVFVIELWSDHVSVCFQVRNTRDWF